MTTIIIGGATATGKSTLAVKTALRLNGEVVSADSMQIYKGMDIGTAKATPQERMGVVHHMIDIISPDAPFSVTEYRDAAEDCIASIKSKGKTPIVAGGTGYYIDSLIYQQQFGVKRDELFFAELMAELQQYGAEHMHQKLQALDAVAAQKIHKNNTKRVIRAIEVVTISKKPFSGQNQIVQKRMTDYLYFCLYYPNREQMYAQIDRRVDEMMESGLLDEARGIVDRFGTNVQSMQAIGYKELVPYFEGTLMLEEAIAQIKQNTRNYAKRQLTWFRRTKDIIWLDCTQPAENIIEIIEEMFSKKQQ